MNYALHVILNREISEEGKADYQIDCVPAPRIAEADKMNDRKEHLIEDCIFYFIVTIMELLLGNLCGIFQKKFMIQRRHCARQWLLSLLISFIFLFCYPDINTKCLQCAESALESVLGDLSHTYFVGNAPMGHMVIQQTENVHEPYKVFQPKHFYFLLHILIFFFKSQVIDTNKFNIGKCKDFVWVTKDELLECFPEQAEFFKKMIIS
ncbi:hypothetical protein CRYUN_Cryun01aG0222800 [Craigia yunnanensis]